ncbi:SUF system NifU family Fe-S cluster assembly protein [Microbacterium sp. zg.Y625]|uniref:Fe-S cluster assembly sulfur transfer protein SufU n=1 Tax=Microbacterium jiangjiandongii TaxID=3049071 RepID=UPI00214BA9A9|nr:MULTISPECIES: SUF system NifU family Fe-S cluster assembly protein [unclassified Microbacterium]MCR2794163.1 SUF system NifU family Fe-S cluster assembly protein [Microbacterium sp. zg.Y625]MCR2816273.1 SUF system NifU family Fe-S cluster assembly protein [Microbacterium sp. zg.Y843]WIM25543.1 SUF system NifU family Fe-S cluster assembly protein [Microbacterium sp. zg-Y625]
MSTLDSLYQELILDHSKHPHARGLAPEDGRTATSHQHNPICGDDITLRARVSDDGETLTSVTWDGSGCSISQASASMLASLVDDRVEADGGMSRQQAIDLIGGFREVLRSRGKLELDEDVYGDATALSGVSKFTARVKCAMLAWVALEDALPRA